MSSQLQHRSGLTPHKTYSFRGAQLTALSQCLYVFPWCHTQERQKERGHRETHFWTQWGTTGYDTWGSRRLDFPASVSQFLWPCSSHRVQNMWICFFFQPWPGSGHQGGEPSTCVEISLIFKLLGKALHQLCLLWHGKLPHIEQAVIQNHKITEW